MVYKKSLRHLVVHHKQCWDVAKMFTNSNKKLEKLNKKHWKTKTAFWHKIIKDIKLLKNENS